MTQTMAAQETSVLSVGQADKPLKKYIIKRAKKLIVSVMIGQIEFTSHNVCSLRYTCALLSYHEP